MKKNSLFFCKKKKAVYSIAEIELSFANDKFTGRLWDEFDQKSFNVTQM